MNRKGPGQLLIRNVDDALKRKLRQRAEQHGQSMEQEARDILRDALKDVTKPRKGLGTEITELFRGVGLKEPIREFRGYSIKTPKFDE